jgi:DNA-binding MarR family transcriptional regulator
MSYRLVKKVLNSDKIEGMHKLVLAILADFVNEDRDGAAWPAHSRIAQSAGCTPRHVVRIIRSLEADGFLHTVRRAGMKGTNRYYIRIENAAEKVTDMTPMSSQPMTFETQRHDTHVIGDMTFETLTHDTHVIQIDKEQIRTNNASSDARPSGAAGALDGNAWENKTARELPCNHDSTMTVNQCPECFAIYRQGEWKPTR